MTSTGTTIVVDGPHDGPIPVGGGDGASTPALTKVLTSLIWTSGSDTGRVEAIRPTDGLGRGIKLRSILLKESGTHCVFADALPDLVWDPEAAGSQIVLVRLEDRVG